MKRRGATIRVKVCGVFGAALLLLGTGVANTDNARSSRAVWRESYRRPAEIPSPADNPYSEAKAKLGRLLFFDRSQRLKTSSISMTAAASSVRAGRI